MCKKVLITGGDGLIGRKLAGLLLKDGYKVNILSRREKPSEGNKKYFVWDVSKGIIDEACFEGVEAVIHLAGENIAARPWSPARRIALLESRTSSIALIYETIKKNAVSSVKTVVSSSATGYYGNRGDEVLTEESGYGDDFLSYVCYSWEQAADSGKELGLRVVKLRTALVLDSVAGVLPKLAATAKKGLALVMGSGRQWMSWIHVEDMAAIYKHALENEMMEGAYNACTLEPYTNEHFTQTLSAYFNKRFITPHVPKLALRIMLGSMKDLLLTSARVSPARLLSAGYKLKYPSLTSALRDLYKKEETPYLD